MKTGSQLIPQLGDGGAHSNILSKGPPASSELFPQPGAGGAHSNIPSKGPPTSSEHQRGAGVRVVAKQQPPGEDVGSGTRPREGIVARSGPRVISEKRMRRSPSSVRRKGAKSVAKGAREGLQPGRTLEGRKQRRSTSVPYDWNKGGRLNELKKR